MKKKAKSIAKQVNEAAELLQLLVRLKSADDEGFVSCVTCGVTRHYKDRMQGGHFISRVRTATKLIEENVKPQCNCCNGPLRGNMIPYTIYMIETHGQDFVEELQSKSRETKKYTKAEVDEIKASFREQIREQEARVCGY